MNPIKSYKGRAVSKIVPVGGKTYAVYFSNGGIGYANAEALGLDGDSSDSSEQMVDAMPMEIPRELPVKGDAQRESGAALSDDEYEIMKRIYMGLDNG